MTLGATWASLIDVTAAVELQQAQWTRCCSLICPAVWHKESQLWILMFVQTHWWEEIGNMTVSHSSEQQLICWVHGNTGSLQQRIWLFSTSVTAGSLTHTGVKTASWQGIQTSTHCSNCCREIHRRPPNGNYWHFSCRCQLLKKVQWTMTGTVEQPFTTGFTHGLLLQKIKAQRIGNRHIEAKQNE